MSEKEDRVLREEEILRFWNERDIFRKTLEKKSPKGEFIFYEGPPTANGRPGIHHLESRAFKDLIPRYKTMRGYHVRRKAGWDTHGLPVEIEVEKELKLTSKKQIEQYGVAEFNKKCRESVLRYIEEWKTFTDRIAFWVDHADTYHTFDPSYIESLWHIVKKISERGLLYKDYKVVPWCPRCGTALSSHELAQGYADVSDTSVYVKFKIKNPKQHGLPDNTYLLAWTTTPWTLPGNIALAVGTDIEYFVNMGRSETYVASVQAWTRGVFGEFGNIRNISLKGSDLIGLEYEPLFPYLKDAFPESEKNRLKNAFKVYAADFVSTEEGTGIVHTAVMYGADDFELGTKVELPKVHLVDEEGKFVDAVKSFAGLPVYEKETNEKIINDLDRHRLLFKKEAMSHAYPHCWRCKTRLIYYARDSWYIKMSALRDELVRENEKIHWEPEHIRDGRFGEWIREVKDWAISRDRYWGTPLPVWVCESCGKRDTVGSYEELAGRARKSGNRYFVMRHGEAESSVEKILSSDITREDHLTEKGRGEVKAVAARITFEDIDVIVCSPYMRTKETAEVLAEELGLDSSTIVYDARLGEIQGGVFDGKPLLEWDKLFDVLNWLNARAEGGETHREVRRRAGKALDELESSYENKKILIITHGGTARVLWMAAGRMTGSAPASAPYLKTAEVRELPFVPLPHNDDFELDPHKPYIDAVELVCSCGGAMRRVSEVMDVWFDSGAMPFAEDHYPFEHKEWIEKEGYPADYISEAIDQTRGWFYTLHAVGALVERGRAYKNVICLGHLLDAEGKKMSKSVGNVVHPVDAIEKFGVDALRFWMYSVNQPGDSKNFDERSIDEVAKKVLNILDNVVRFYELYASNLQPTTYNLQPNHVLDRWVLSLFGKLVQDVTRYLDGYKVFEAARAIREFIQDLSTWYVRRSRDRFKSEDAGDREAAAGTTRFVLLELAKLIAPFMPFLAEDVYTRAGDVRESVHLEDWPEGGRVDEKLLAEMGRVRTTVSQALEMRARAGIKVRQPLARLTLAEKIPEEYHDVIRDEVNVKEILVDTTMPERIALDTDITPELKEEGNLREFIRNLQDLRKKKGLAPRDAAALHIATDEMGQAFVEKFADRIKAGAHLSLIRFMETEGETFSIEGHSCVCRLV